MSDTVLVRAAAAEVRSDAPGSLITLLAESPAFTANRATLDAGVVGTPAHFHTRATELFLVLGGSLQVLTGDELHTLDEGDFLAVPPHVPHAFGPAAGSSADVLVAFTPGMDRFGYYRLLDRVARGEADPKEIGESGARYDNHYVDSPVWSRARATSASR
ncbi:quercetin dioxygenase-like cupin family protein [Prauserella shujinwangii]|uniref:Quercetin dioxygenase-like cupin family protein n=1 Tax=Prauserella shujinwangii TaxID=1453103 RepID=A0A2T0M0M7_9PSEU|nr:cupin domain-containing protein [Prauserella shujinwangii]PRX50138.1 quercetin dioxygenase-like cupin family protein [Prauserella shujinwangii]